MLHTVTAMPESESKPREEVRVDLANLPPPPVPAPEGHFMLIEACKEIGVRVNHFILGRVGCLMTEFLEAEGTKPVVVNFGEPGWIVGVPARPGGALKRVCAYPESMRPSFERLMGLPLDDLPLPRRWVQQDRQQAGRKQARRKGSSRRQAAE